MSGATVLFDAPGPRARVRHRILAGLTVVVFALVLGWVIWKFAAADQFTAAKWEPFLTANLWTTYVLPGIEGTLTAAAVSIVAALVLGCLLGVGRLSPIPAVSWACATFVEFFRAVPVLIMMLFSYALFAQYNVFPSEYLALAGVITGLTLYNSAVIAEIVRSGVHSLPRGQAEAASTPCTSSRPRRTKRRPPDGGRCALRRRRFSVQLGDCGDRRRPSRPGVISPLGKSIRVSSRAHLRMSRSGNFTSKRGGLAPKCTDREILIDFGRLGRQMSRSVNSCIHL